MRLQVGEMYFGISPIVLQSRKEPKSWSPIYFLHYAQLSTPSLWIYAKRMLSSPQNLNLFLEKIGFILHMQNNSLPLEGFLLKVVVERFTFSQYVQNMPEIYKFCTFLW